MSHWGAHDRIVHVQNFDVDVDKKLGEGGYCLEDTLSRRPDPLTLADALTCIATDECKVPERFADLLEASQNSKGTLVTMVDAEGQFSGSL